MVVVGAYVFVVDEVLMVRSRSLTWMKRRNASTTRQRLYPPHENCLQA